MPGNGWGPAEVRILVTGRDGQVARSLAERAGPDHELAFAARPDMDLGDPASIENVVRRIGPDLIVSAAAYTAVDAAEDDREAAHAINAVAPGVLAAEAKRLSAPIIHISTDYVFDGNSNRPYREDDPTGPASVYGATKLEGEQAVSAACADHAIIRTAWVYGPFGKNFLKTMLRAAADRDELTVVDDQIGCPTSSLEIANSILAVVSAWRSGVDRESTGLFHVAGAGETSWAGLAREIFEASRERGGPWANVRGIATADWPTRAVRPANSRLNSARFARTFGYRSPAWEVSVRETVDRLSAG